MAWNDVIQHNIISQVAQQSNIPLVVVCIPHWGEVTMEWAVRTFVPIYTAPHPAFQKDIRMARGLLNLDAERNSLVRDAFAIPGMTHIFFLDTDIVFENPQNPNDAIYTLMKAMNQTGESVVSGLYRTKQKDGFFNSMWKSVPGTNAYSPIQSWDGNWVFADTIGFGCVLLKREVFEKTQYPWFLWEDKDKPSEDFYFCEKLRSQGYRIAVYTDVKCSHSGHLKVMPDGTVTVLSF